MIAFDRLKLLCDEQGISINILEERIGLGKNTLYSWKTKVPGGINLQKVADYFDVSTDFLLGRTDKRHYYDLTEKDERDLEKELQGMINDLGSNGAFAYSKEDGEIDEETRELLIGSLEQALKIAKIEAKKRYTPKKYREESYEDEKD